MSDAFIGKFILWDWLSQYRTILTTLLSLFLTWLSLVWACSRGYLSMVKTLKKLDGYGVYSLFVETSKPSNATTEDGILIGLVIWLFLSQKYFAIQGLFNWTFCGIYFRWGWERNQEYKHISIAKSCHENRRVRQLGNCFQLSTCSCQTRKKLI